MPIAKTPTYREKLQISPGPCTVRSLFAHCSEQTTTLYLLLFDQVTEPSVDAESDYPPIPLKPNGNEGSYFESNVVRTFASGCWAMLSTSTPTYTAFGSDNVYIAALVE